MAKPPRIGNHFEELMAKQSRIGSHFEHLLGKYCPIKSKCAATLGSQTRLTQNREQSSYLYNFWGDQAVQSRSTGSEPVDTQINQLRAS